MNGKPINPWSRLFAALSRRQFLRRAAGAGIALGSGLLIPGKARADDNLLPTPIPFAQLLPPAVVHPPQQYGPFHAAFPGPVDSPGPFCNRPAPFIPSLINNFNGFYGVAAGSGTATDGSGNTFAMDNRFMKGVYVGEDGQNHRGAFAFI